MTARGRRAADGPPTVASDVSGAGDIRQCGKFAQYARTNLAAKSIEVTEALVTRFGAADGDGQPPRPRVPAVGLRVRAGRSRLHVFPNAGAFGADGSQWLSGPDQGFGVGVHRFTGEPQPLDPSARLFTFIGSDVLAQLRKLG